MKNLWMKNYMHENRIEKIVYLFTKWTLKIDNFKSSEYLITFYETLDVAGAELPIGNMVWELVRQWGIVII